MAAPAVSVLMGVHDGAAWISRAIASVLTQTLADLELIVVVDGSADATPTLLAGVRDPRLVVERQARAGLAVTLNIVGFTLTGQKVKSELTTLAGSTGGNYFGAASADQLSQAVRLAALPRMPFEILDSSGRVLASGQTGEPARELTAGQYLVRIKVPGQPLEQKVTIVAGQMKTLSFAYEGDKLVLRP